MENDELLERLKETGIENLINQNRNILEITKNYTNRFGEPIPEKQLLEITQGNLLKTYEETNGMWVDYILEKHENPKQGDIGTLPDNKETSIKEDWQLKFDFCGDSNKAADDKTPPPPKGKGGRPKGKKSSDSEGQDKGLKMECITPESLGKYMSSYLEEINRRFQELEQANKGIHDALTHLEEGQAQIKEMISRIQLEVPLVPEKQKKISTQKIINIVRSKSQNVSLSVKKEIFESLVTFVKNNYDLGSKPSTSDIVEAAFIEVLYGKQNDAVNNISSG